MIDPLPSIADGHRLVHIGVFKSGTTSVQGALALARQNLADLGVVYPGDERTHKNAAVALTGGRGIIGDPPMDLSYWERLVDQVSAAGDHRVIVSSEWLCQATDEQAAKAVRELGGDRVNVVVTLRPLGKILPSSWQQYVQNGYRGDYLEWLSGTLKREGPQPTKTFWKRHRHDVVLARWTKLTAPDRVTVIIVDSSDHDLLLRQFEQLLGLPAGLLVPEPPNRDNRSLSEGEAELVRRINNRFYDEEWPPSLYRKAVRFGSVRQLAQARPNVAELQPIITPQWALDEAAEIGAEMATKIRGLGIRIAGDLDSLSRPQGELTREHPPTMVPVELAAEAVLGAIVGARQQGRKERRPVVQRISGAGDAPVAEKAPPPPTPTPTLLPRLRAAVRRRLR